ncbi:bifunctional 2-polyprenyl-6-hydroxyphenol methylase/3-demethylubiquinol 3-O-methyltransferase UbiG [Microlunatus sp. Gsoil 973]|uniref:class I SAM-dependent methyltransferase n=1 Tax=Microlunatus sp. Gsoil 973 TaxID=2672569 RepID=UPI0012B447E5|nr:class I SAM-dependent methyltransferase [Microlunatus sp. Gsoil 973]QGN32869.1 methyltransferase domain-containing protein [Microlunatus sp. Gsoil 973]
MTDDPDGYFGADVAAGYDDPESPMFQAAQIAPAVERLAELAGDGRALEFAIGTGRIALPLAERGVPVEGIELSRAMVDQLRTKAGGQDIEVAIGDMTSAVVPGEFALVYLVFNTIMNLTSQRAQTDCFRNAARHLRPGGRFVIEVMVPDLRRLPPGQDAVPFDVSERHLGFDTYDTATQEMTSHHITFVEGRPRYAAVPFRYAWPAELDLMAELAGMGLENRWATWSGEPFTGESRSHVSVWQKA